MQNYELLELLQLEMRTSGYDIKAEPQLLQALQKGMSYDDFLVSSDQLFRREYGKDIADAEITDDRNESVLNLHLSRSGLYDHLPEGLFFQQPTRSNRPVTVAEMATYYKQNKKTEGEIRRFFLPFEHDFFLQRMQLEKEENILLQGLQSGLLNDYFNQFWNLPDAIPRKLIGQFILLLPYAYKIAGDFELTAQCMQLLLREEVTIVQKTATATNVGKMVQPLLLGDSLLGFDMVCGDDFWEGEPTIEMEIGPLMYSQIADYLEGGNRFVLIETFNRFFMPAGIDVNISVRLPVEKMNMALIKGEEPILGYSSVLG